MSSEQTAVTRHELTKLLIRLSRLNFRLDEHLSAGEIRGLRELRLRTMAELFKVSIQIRGEHSLSESEAEELRQGSAQDESLLGFMMRFTARGHEEETDQEALSQRERELLKKKLEIENRLSSVKLSRAGRGQMAPHELAAVRRERDALREKVEKLLERRDFYLGQVRAMRDLAGRDKSERIYETLARLERHTRELPAIASLRLLADLLTGESVTAQRALRLVIQSDNDVFLQTVLAYHESFVDDEVGAARAMIVAILKKHSSFKFGLLENTEAFFRSKTFRRDRSLHSLVLYNPSAPVSLLRHLLRVPLRELKAATERAAESYGSTEILDVLTELTRATTDKTRLRHILEITASDPIRRTRFERVLSYRDDIGAAGVLQLRPKRARRRS